MEKPITFVRIRSQTDCRDNELRDRASQSSKGRLTIQYRALKINEELAFVSLDRHLELQTLAIYELFVPSRMRNQGRGKMVLEAIESLAEREGFLRITVTPRPLDSNFPQSRLVSWYERQKYFRRVDCTSEFEKVLLGDADR
jgi:GNAT superfamily N-acetyltransferase